MSPMSNPVKDIHLKVNAAGEQQLVEEVRRGNTEAYALLIRSLVKQAYNTPGWGPPFA